MITPIHVAHSHPSITYTGSFFNAADKRVSVRATGTVTVTVTGASLLRYLGPRKGQVLSVSVSGGAPTTVTLPNDGLSDVFPLVTGMSKTEHQIVVTVTSGTLEVQQLQIDSGSFMVTKLAKAVDITLTPGGGDYKFWVDKTVAINISVLALGQRLVITLADQWPGYVWDVPNTGTIIKHRVAWGMLPYPTQVTMYSLAGSVRITSMVLVAGAGVQPAILQDDDPNLTNREVLCVFGDSITAGQNTLGPAQVGNGYGHWLARARGWRLTNAGVGGQNAYCYGRDKAWIIAFRKPAPTRIIVAFGANDIIPGSGYDLTKCDPTIDDFDGAIRSIITTLKTSTAATIYVSGILPISGLDETKRTAWNARISQACTDLGVLYLDVASAAGLSLNQDFSDGLHPHIGGHKKMADAWSGFMANPQPFVIASTTDIGVLSRPDNVLRDGGLSAHPFAERILWLFGDTILPGVSSDSSHALSALASPEDLDRGTPDQYIPHTDAETAWNDANSPADRYALWPNSLIPLANGNVAIFFSKIHVSAQPWTNDGIFWAVATPGAATATRGATALFDGAEPRFSGGSCLSRDGTYIYLYSQESTGGFNYGHRVARVPRASYQDKTTYRFWNGSSWVTNSAQATLVMNPGGSSGLTVIWNSYLGKYLAAYTKPLTSDIYMRIADAPEGPWASEVIAFTGKPAGGTGLASVDYSAYQHRELATLGGKSVVISYARSLGAWDAEIRLHRVTFQ